MFKSLFRKYLAAFVIMIVISASLIIVFISRGMDNFAYSLKGDMLESTSHNAVGMINSFISLMNQDIDYLLNQEPEQIQTNLDIWATDSDSLVFITDDDGNVLMTSKNFSSTGKSISSNVIASLLSGNKEYNVSTLNGFFGETHLCYTEQIEQSFSEKSPILFVCSPATQVNAFTQKLTRAIITAVLIVFLVMLVAVYFISRKISEPLKEMSIAARSFAKGDFDVRVTVKGNDEIAELAVAFNNMASSLGKLEDTRRSFIANVSHDLRSPMTSIAGFIDGILDGAIKPEEQGHYLAIVKSEIGRLSRLVSNLLDISRIEVGERKFSRSVFDICEMTRQILISCESRIEGKHLNVEFNCDEESMRVYSDMDAIYQVTYNICDNAIKFANEKGLLRISIKRSSKEKKILVSIKNTGVGIAKDDLPLVFDRFYKTDKSRGLDKTGTGLGLYIVKTILESLDEKIQVESVENEYCEFFFTLKEADHEKSSRKRLIIMGKEEN